MALIVDEKSELQKVSTLETYKYPKFVRVLALVFSYVFHPLFIPIYLTIFLIRVHPYMFGGFTDEIKWRTLLQVTFTCTLLPLVSVSLMRGLKLIDSIHLRTQKERIVPYVTIMVFYFWNWHVFSKLNLTEDLTIMSMAIFLGCVFGFLANIYFKISMHAIAMGVMVAFIGLITYTDSQNLTIHLSVAVLIAGLVCTSRLIVSDHNSKEVYLGFVFGLFALFVAYWFT